MNELAEMTVREAIATLLERIERSRRTEENARIDRERDEAALVALRGLVSGGSEPQAEPEPPPPDGTPLGIAAVRGVMRENSSRIWTPRDIHEILVQRGWISGKAQHPRAGTESAVGRLLAKGEIEKVGRGQYRWIAKQEAPPEG